MHKLGHLYGNDDIPHEYGQIFTYDIYPNYERLTVASDKKQIHLLLQLVKGLSENFGILYVLSSPRLGHPAARYQSDNPCNYEELELFLYTFQEYFEEDGRHNLWIFCLDDDSQVIYDKHNIIYCYGDIEKFKNEINQNGYTEKEVNIPSPHSHYYHPEHDKNEDEIMEYWEWKQFELQEMDD
ncbi:MAG: hypothetical protein NE327_16675 [Lentisphaeraceae bacterium]|nr:hypothetical protein [Lentisphaeraceae bacterium]